MTASLENNALRLELDRAAGGLTAITNKLTGETYTVAGDSFVVETTAFRRAQAELRQVEWIATADTVTTRYADADLTVEVAYELRPGDHFFQKRLAVTFAAAGGVTQLTLSQPAFTSAGMMVVCYRHPDFNYLADFCQAKHGWGWDLRRPEGSEPSRTFFGRTAAGGFFTGLEMPCDNSRLADGRLTLGYAPNLKVKAGERLEGETLYFGLYRRGADDVRAAEWGPISAAALVGSMKGGFDGATEAGFKVGPGAPGVGAASAFTVWPLPSESEGMRTMIAALFGPPRHGLKAHVLGWGSQMHHHAYDTEEQLERDIKALEFCAAVGVDGEAGPQPWNGDALRLAAMREGERHALAPRARRLLERARELGLEMSHWTTITNTQPWSDYGAPFRPDRPEWRRVPEAAYRSAEKLTDAQLANIHAKDRFRWRQDNCLGCGPFADWLERLILDETLGTGLFRGWDVDGDFWGGGGYWHTTLPVTCEAEDHDHLPGDANYACQRRLLQLIARVRERYPDLYINMCRPIMDLGVWAQRHVDACFTLIESSLGDTNLSAGDAIRTLSRVRLHHHFFPHWLDWPLLFPPFGPSDSSPWRSARLDYILLSAFSCSPNLALWLPAVTGIPEADKAEIRKWLDWGRANIEYLLVRHDLFDWPGKGKMDGSAHLVDGRRGLIFLFNSAAEERRAEFELTEEGVGFTGTGPVEIRQEYPVSDRSEIFQPGATVRWPVPAATPLVLRVGK